MKISKKYLLGVMFLILVVVFLSNTTTGCNPHRSGPTAKQLGASNGKKYHTKTATAKRRRKRKY